MLDAPAAAAEPAQICKNFLLVSVIVPSLLLVLGRSKPAEGFVHTVMQIAGSLMVVARYFLLIHKKRSE
jgi:hypothetical protein